MSNRPLSPVAVWSFWVTTTPPLASSRLICDEPPGPGAAAGMVAPALEPAGPPWPRPSFRRTPPATLQCMVVSPCTTFTLPVKVAILSLSRTSSREASICTG